MLSLSLCVPLLSQAAKLPDAVTLLDRREVALGPIEKRTAPHGLTIEGVWGMAENALTSPFEERYLVGADAERVYVGITMEGWGTTSQGTDGKVSWTTDLAFGVAINEGSEQMGRRRMWAIQRSAPWRSLYSSARTLREVERGGRALYELEMQPKEGKPDRWYLDRATNELARVAVVYPGPTGERLPMEITLGDWKPVDGVLYAHRRGQEILGGVAPTSSDAPSQTAEASAPLMRIFYTCTSIRRGALDPAAVAPPPEVAEAIRDPKKRAPAPGPDPASCTLERVELRPVATVRLEIDSDKVSESIARTLSEVGRVIREQDAEMAGPPFSRYHSIDTEKKRIDIEVGIPVRTPIEASGRVKPSELPAGRTAMTWHVGSYRDLQKSYDRLGAWMKSQDVKPRGGFWEIYWTDPGLEPDPSTWRTQIYWPVE